MKMTEDKEFGPFLTAIELADKLKVKLSWIRWMTFQKKIPVYRLGKYRRYVLSEVLQALES